MVEHRETLFSLGTLKYIIKHFKLTDRNDLVGKEK